MELRKPLKVPVDQDCTISKRVNGKWNLNVPYPAELIRAPPPTRPLKGHHQEAHSASIGARKIRLSIKNKITSFHDIFKQHMVTNFAFLAHGDINVKNIVRNKSAEDTAAGRHGLSGAGKGN